MLEFAFDVNLDSIPLGCPRHADDTEPSHRHRWKVKNPSLSALTQKQIDIISSSSFSVNGPVQVSVKLIYVGGSSSEQSLRAICSMSRVFYFVLQLAQCDRNRVSIEHVVIEPRSSGG